MAEEKTTENEREYVIPLRWGARKVPRYKRAEKAIRIIKEFLVRHMKVYDRDLKKIKIDKYLNEEVWFRGIKKPPHKIKVKVTKEGNVVRAELSEYKDKLKFKKAREEKLAQKAEEAARSKKAKAPEEPAHDHAHPEEKSEEQKEEEKEKKASVVEAGQKMEKEAAKKQKHQPKEARQPKHQRRKALKK